jgi:hypothetical protein
VLLAWAEREWTNLQLEALMEKMHECDVYLARRRDSALESKPATPERDCISELDAVAALYLPELKSETDRFFVSCKIQDVLINQLGQAVMKSRDDLAARQAAYQNFQSQFEHDYGEFLAAQNALREAAHSLLKRIMNVDEGA